MPKLRTSGVKPVTTHLLVIHLLGQKLPIEGREMNLKSSVDIRQRLVLMAEGLQTVSEEPGLW